MNYQYADIHCHMLPGLDDGAKNLQMTEQMLEIAYAEGIRRLFFTPHFVHGRNRYHPQDLDVVFSFIKEESAERYPDLELYLGNEVMWSSRICDHLRAGDIHTMNNTRYVLVEFPIHLPSTEILNAADDIMNIGFWPVIAHVERYGDLMDHMENMEELIQIGAYLQMNTRTVIGKRFDSFSKKCHHLLEQGFISFLGTDAHNITSRPPEYRKAARWLEKHVPFAEDLIWNNADYLVSGEIL